MTCDQSSLLVHDKDCLIMKTYYIFMIISKNKRSQYAHDVVLTSVRRRFNVMDVVWTSKRCRVLTGIHFDAFFLNKNVSMSSDTTTITSIVLFILLLLFIY